jgi:hypothetical protein
VPRVNAVGDRHQILGDDLFCDLLSAVKSHRHFAMNLIDATPTDGVMGMVFKQQAPGSPD